MKNFYPVTPELAETLRQGKLTAAEWRIWSYLIGVDPWEKQFLVTGEIREIKESVKISQATS